MRQSFMTWVFVNGSGGAIRRSFIDMVRSDASVVCVDVAHCFSLPPDCAEKTSVAAVAVQELETSIGPPPLSKQLNTPNHEWHVW
jgi:hypothetical protein